MHAGVKSESMSLHSGVRRRNAVAPLNVSSKPELSLLQRATRRQKEACGPALGTALPWSCSFNIEGGQLPGPSAGCVAKFGRQLSSANVQFQLLAFQHACHPMFQKPKQWQAPGALWFGPALQCCLMSQGGPAVLVRNSHVANPSPTSAERQACKHVSWTSALSDSVTRLQTGDGWKELPAWQEQLTLRMFAWSLVVGVPFTVIILKLSLTAGEKVLALCTCDLWF